MRPATRSLHSHNSPTGTEADPQPANLAITPAGSQLQAYIIEKCIIMFGNRYALYFGLN